MTTPHHFYTQIPVEGCECYTCDEARAGRSFEFAIMPYLEREFGLAPRPVLPTDAATRNGIPLATGCLDYFPLALAAIAECSRIANEQHNPGEPMHWARGKSTEHADKILKHLVDRGLMDTDNIRHSTKLAWRALALLQQELEEAGGTPGRASVFPTK